MKKILKKIYDLIPLKKEIFTVLKKTTNLPPSVYKHLHFKGLFTVKFNSDKELKLHHLGYMQENDIFWKGIPNGWEKKSLALWIELSKNCNSIFDIGANTGVYALVAKTINPTAEVYAFEPIPAVYKALQKNIASNNFNIKSYELGLSDYDGKAKIFLLHGVDFDYSVTVNKNLRTRSKVDEVSIDVQKLSTFIEFNAISKIDLMKLDVETHEVEVLKGMGIWLKQFKPTLIIEVLSDEIAEQLNEIFKDMDYLYFNIDDEKNSIRQTDKITKSYSWNFLLCTKLTAQNLQLL